MRMIMSSADLFEEIIAADPFANAMSADVDRLRRDDLAMVLFVHHMVTRNGVYACRCGEMAPGEMHSFHVAEVIRREVPAQRPSRSTTTERRL